MDAVSYMIDVWAKSAKNLRSTSVMGNQSPYVEVMSSTELVARTSSVHKNGGQNAEWGDFIGGIKVWGSKMEHVHIVVKASSWTTDVVIGSVKLSVTKFMTEDENEPNEKWFDLTDRGVFAGSVLLKYVWRMNRENSITSSLDCSSKRTPLKYDDITPLTPAIALSGDVSKGQSGNSDIMPACSNRVVSPAASSTDGPRPMMGSFYIKKSAAEKQSTTAPVGDKSAKEQAWNDCMSELDRVHIEHHLPPPPDITAVVNGEISGQSCAETPCHSTGGAFSAILDNSALTVKTRAQTDAVSTSSSSAKAQFYARKLEKDSSPLLPLPVVEALQVKRAATTAPNSLNPPPHSQVHANHADPVGNAAWVMDKNKERSSKTVDTQSGASPSFMVKGSAVKMASPPSKIMPPSPPNSHVGVRASTVRARVGGQSIVKPTCPQKLETEDDSFLDLGPIDFN
jgi:hypothetical protein